MALEEEAEFLATYLDKATRGGILIVSESNRHSMSDREAEQH